MAVTKPTIGQANWGPIVNAALDALDADIADKADSSTVAAHTGSSANPHAVTKTQVGLGSVDNTSDTNKPVSTAQQTALDAAAAALGVMSVTPTGSAAANVTSLQAALTAAAAAGSTLRVRGAFSVNGTVTVPTGLAVDLHGATITQTTSLTPTFEVNGTAGVRIRGGTLQGKTTDYVNSSSTYGAAAVVVRTGSTDTIVDGVTMLGWAGAGVQVDAGAGDVTVRNCRMTGPGAAYLINNTYGFSAGVRMLATAGLLTVTGCDISQFAQGVTTADGVASVIVTGNKIHDIPSQHGAYFHTLTRLLFADNHIWNTGVTGMKVQMDTTATAEAVDLVIQGNTFTTVAAQAVLLTNVGGSGGTLLRRATITGNIVDGCQTGVEANALASAVVSSNVVYNASVKGIHLNNMGSATVSLNRINTATAQGIHLDTVTDIQAVNNRIVNAGQGAVSTTQFGIHMVGVCLDILLDGNVITNTTAATMRYGIYSNPTSGQDTFTIRDNYVSGGYDYAIRCGTATAMREFRGNNLVAGALGLILNPPTSGQGRPAAEWFGSALPTTGLYRVSDIYWNSAPAASGTMGWVCVTAGQLAPIWVISTAYVVGDYRYNGTRVYIVTTAGTSAGSGGPTGTGTGIADGTVVWNYVTTLAVFKTFGAIAA